MSKHIGSSFTSFLDERGLRARVEMLATKRVIADDIARLMADAGISKTELARRMATNRVAVNRLLDPTNTGVTLATLEKAAVALGMRFACGLVALDEVPALPPAGARRADKSTAVASKVVTGQAAKIAESTSRRLVAAGWASKLSTGRSEQVAGPVTPPGRDRAAARPGRDRAAARPDPR